MSKDPLDILTNEIEQDFMQFGGWKECRYLLGKLVGDKDAEIAVLRKQLNHLAGYALAAKYRNTAAYMEGLATVVNDSCEILGDDDRWEWDRGVPHLGGRFRKRGDS